MILYSISASPLACALITFLGAVLYECGTGFLFYTGAGYVKFYF